MTAPPATADLAALRQQSEYKTRLLNAVAHELGTPITPIRLHLHLLERRKDLDPETRRSLQVVSRNVERLHALIRDVLEVARLESDRFPVRFATIDLRQCVVEAADDYRAAAEAAGLDLRVQAASGLVVQADAQRIIQVLHNFIRNAIRFTPAGRRIEMIARRNGADVEVLVRDEGVGFDPDRSPRLFQPFSQLGGAIREAYHGAGLGLYISKGIVDLHGGTIWGESGGEGRGATFGFRIPGRPGPGQVAATDRLGQRQREFTDRIRSLV